MEASPKLAITHYAPPADPCALPKALLVVAAAKDVSHPDSWTIAGRFARERKGNGPTTPASGAERPAEPDLADAVGGQLQKLPALREPGGIPAKGSP